ncbi:flagellar basal body-associated FliL family protein [Streptacidiphilus rugosus]|uniref:hypothetical protein n=1 Tax=Streptacidiphilus rugosus TaxID=405783 RepID=UPI00056C993F|nr:hypothetical protein [Streptacidiphilus rugosus]
MSTEAHTPEATPAPATEPAKAPRSRGRFVALAAAFVLSAVAVGGGTGALILAARSSGTAAKPVAQKPYLAPAFGVRPDGSHFGPLDELLLPVPAADAPGADDTGLGGFDVLAPSQYSAAFLEEYRFLDAGKRGDLQSRLGLSDLQGYAVAGYADSDDGLEFRISLMQESPAHRDAASAALQRLASLTGGYRAGPTVTGYPHAHCYFPPNPFGASSSLERLRCEDVEGDLLITMQVDGVSPIAQSAATDFLRQQLTRLATPAAQV